LAEKWGDWTHLDLGGQDLSGFVNSRLGVQVTSSDPRKPHG
jgi:hypothetical protein